MESFPRLRDILGFVGAHFLPRPQVPQGAILVDSHFHIGRGIFRTSEDISVLVDTFFDSNVGMQAICDYGLFTPLDHVVPYEEFISGIRTAHGVEIAFSDKDATVAYKGDKRIIFTRGIEVETRVDEDKEGHGLFRTRHDMHLAVECFEDIHAETTREVLEELHRQRAYVTVAHPFAVPTQRPPHPIFAFLPANAQERCTIGDLAREFNLALEGLNGATSLWMAPLNGAVREFAYDHRFPLIYSTDSHTRPLPELFQRGSLDKYSLFRR